jgi:hypothetical protein
LISGGARNEHRSDQAPKSSYLLSAGRATTLSKPALVDWVNLFSLEASSEISSLAYVQRLLSETRAA